MYISTSNYVLLKYKEIVKKGHLYTKRKREKEDHLHTKRKRAVTYFFHDPEGNMRRRGWIHASYPPSPPHQSPPHP